MRKNSRIEKHIIAQSVSQSGTRYRQSSKIPQKNKVNHNIDGSPARVESKQFGEETFRNMENYYLQVDQLNTNMNTSSN